MTTTSGIATLIWLTILTLAGRSQEYGKPDRSAPGDELIQSYLRTEATKLDSQFSRDLSSREVWESKRSQHYEEYMYMLGLSPRPEKTALKATITRTLDRGDHVVEMIHYQSRPGLYVTGNLYRPAKITEGQKLPAVLYVCGHSGRGRDGNKVAFQSHGIWFARHGYVCFIIDSLELGEIASKHHGTYSLGRWWWHSRGYTPAGVEAWNGVRGIDYLVSRPDVDADRIAVTGISGGGAATLWISAADERVKVAVPVSGMADLESYVGSRVVNGHCDCMFLYNAHRWPWSRIAGLIAPRALLFANSDQDAIYPMDANERIAGRLERLYSLYGASDRVDAFVSVGGHDYRRDIRQAAFRFINAHLKGDARPVTDSEVDLTTVAGNVTHDVIPGEQLRVFPTDADLPGDHANANIDRSFVPMAKVDPPSATGYIAWRKDLLAKVRQTSFQNFPESIGPAAAIGQPDSDGWERMRSDDGLEFRLRYVPPAPGAQGKGRGSTDPLLVVLNNAEAAAGSQPPSWVVNHSEPGQPIVLCEPRGIGATRWTTQNPPNYVERCHVLLGRTVDNGRVQDVIAAARAVSIRLGSANGSVKLEVNVHVAGSKSAGVIAAYAAALDDRIGGAVLVDPPASHMDAAAPQFLNILRASDIPDTLGLIAPRSLTLVGVDATGPFGRTMPAYTAAGGADRLQFEK